MKCQKSIVSLCCLLFIVSIISGCRTNANSEKKPIKIGALYPLTGNVAQMGQQELKGSELAVKQINEAGGIDGHKIVLVKADAPDPNAAVAEAERLSTVEQVPIIVGSYSSGISFAATAVAEKNGVIYWEMGAMTDSITQRGFKYTLRTTMNASTLAKSAVDLIEQLVAPKLKKAPKDLRIAIINESSAYGTSNADNVEKQLKARGMNVVLRESYDANTNDLSSLVLKLKKLNPDVLQPTNYNNDGILFYKQAQELGYTPTSIVLTGNCNREFRQGVGDKISESMISSWDGPDPERPQNNAPGQKEFFDLYQKTYGEQPIATAIALRSFFGMNILADIIKSSQKDGKINADDFLAAAYKVDIPVGKTPMGWGVKFVPPGNPDSGNNERTSAISFVVHKGNLYAVFPPEAASADNLSYIQLPLKPFRER
jgi:branched-chain amino acid transport system substrate-binding protein